MTLVDFHQVELPPPLTQHVHTDMYIQTDGDQIYTKRVVTPFGTTRLKILSVRSDSKGFGLTMWNSKIGFGTQDESPVPDAHAHNVKVLTVSLPFVIVWTFCLITGIPATLVWNNNIWTKQILLNLWHSLLRCMWTAASRCATKKEWKFSLTTILFSLFGLFPACVSQTPFRVECSAHLLLEEVELFFCDSTSFERTPDALVFLDSSVRSCTQNNRTMIMLCVEDRRIVAVTRHPQK